LVKKGSLIERKASILFYKRLHARERDYSLSEEAILLGPRKKRRAALRTADSSDMKVISERTRC